MSLVGAVPGLRHESLRPGDGSSLREADLTDRRRLGVVLEGVAVAAHLELCGAAPVAGWATATVGPSGHLRSVTAEVGERMRFPQRRALELIELLFRVPVDEAGRPHGPTGRGQGRRCARELWRIWSQTTVRVRTERLLSDLFEVAPFLRSESMAGYRRSLVGFHGQPSAEVSRVVVGPRLCDRAATGATGRASRPGPPTARSLLFEGYVSEALRFLESYEGTEAEIATAEARLLSGRFAGARSLVRRTARGRLRASLRLRCLDIERRAATALREQARLVRLADEALAIARGELRVPAILVAASARVAADQPDRAFALLAGLPMQLGADEARRRRCVEAEIALARSRGTDAALLLEQSLRGRRSMTALEAGETWLLLSVARGLADDAPGAERALRHAHLLAARFPEGPLFWQSLARLAVHRSKEGCDVGCSFALERALTMAKAQGDRDSWIGLRLLDARRRLSRGRSAEVLEACAEILGAGDTIGRERSYARALLRAAGADVGEAPAVAPATGDDSVWLDPEERVVLRRLEAVAAQEKAVELDRVWTELRSESLSSRRGWALVGDLSPYRGARFIAELCRLAPGRVPISRLELALALLKRHGNEAAAGRLRASLRTPWTALRAFLEGEGRGVAAIARLFREAGLGEVCVRFVGPTRSLDVVDGSGGSEQRSLEVRGGRLVLEADEIEDDLDVLFGLAAENFEPPWSPPRIGSTMLGSSDVFLRAIARLDRLAEGSLPVLLLGESGTGKELAAARVHECSPRTTGPYLTYNSAAVAEHLLLSDLFGHSRGAFTGADRDRAGIFETANGGTVLLDEIGDLPLAAQGALLRVLQEGEVRRLGESRCRRVDVRVVAATHRNLEDAVGRGVFRHDLLYRLGAGRVVLPALRDRGGDVELLARELARRAGARRLSQGAMDLVLRHSWPGNVRELQNALEVGAALAGGGRTIRACHLDLPSSEKGSKLGYHDLVDRYRRHLLREALHATEGHRASAARRLGITRQALSYLVRKLELVDP